MAAYGQYQPLAKGKFGSGLAIHLHSSSYPVRNIAKLLGNFVPRRRGRDINSIVTVSGFRNQAIQRTGSIVDDFNLIALNGWLIAIFRPLSWAALVAVIVLATRQANRLKSNALLWAMIAVTAYLIPFITIRKVSNYAVNNVEYNPALFLFLILCVHVFSILAGLGACYGLKKWHSARHPVASPEPQALIDDTDSR